MNLKKAEEYLNKELGFVKNTLISYPEVIKAMAKYVESEAINYSQCCESDSEQLKCEHKYGQLKDGTYTCFDCGHKEEW